jgi:GGDEF domain-containing protein
VLLIDLDRFTEINNTLGTANGDLVLCEIARRLRGNIQDDALVHASLATDTQSSYTARKASPTH